MDIPFRQLSEEALRGVIVEYVTREGTDVGLKEFSLDEKISQVVRQLEEGSVFLTWDEETQSPGIRA